MTPTLVAKRLLEIEAAVADLDWRRNGVNVWPLYRNLLRIRLFGVLVGEHAEGQARPGFSKLWGGSVRGAGGSAGCTVLLNDGFSLQQMGGATIDRFCTPLSMALDRIGASNVLLDQGFSRIATLATHTHPIGPAILRAKVRSLVRASLLPDPWVGLRQRRLRQAALTIGLDPAVVPTVRDLAARQAAVFDLADTFERLLALFRADRVLQVSYYSVVGYAMNLAARRLGLQTIDIQHGVITPVQLAYAGWSLPAGDDKLMPTGYWTWSETEAAVIDGGQGLNKTLTIVGGHPLAGAWREGWLPGGEDARAEAKSLRALRPAFRHALVSLQPGLMSRAELQPILAAMEAHKDTYWWVRLHPASLLQAPSITDLLEETGAAYNIEAATRLPLYAILENIDVNLTHSSTTIIEAAMFGVPSIIWSEYGRDFFRDLIAAGHARCALDGATISQLFDALPERPEHGIAPPPRITNALLELLR